MNKVFVMALLVLMLALFTACTQNGADDGNDVLNGETNGEVDGGYYETPPVSATPPFAPPVVATPPAVTTPRPLTAFPTPTPLPVMGVTLTYEDGRHGVNFNYYKPLGWRLLERRHLFETRNGPDSVILSNGDFSFMLHRGTTHPERWLQQVFGGEAGIWMVQFWEQPDEPAEVFVTEHGLTVVKYVNLHTRYDFISGVPNAEHITVVYIFREDGRDYREFDGTQILFTVMADALSGDDDEYLSEVRAFVENIEFFDTANVTRAVSETGQALGITAYNYPRIDGSTSAANLMQLIFEAMYDSDEQDPWRYWGNSTSRTMPSYELLINGYVDMVISPNPSAHVMLLAERENVELEFIPIGVEALVFVTAADNPVSEITLEQVLAIYADMTVTDWSELGGYEGRIVPFSRNPHSGSQALMNMFVLEQADVNPELSGYQVGGMSGMLSLVARWHNRSDAGVFDFGLGYTVYFFLEQQSETWRNYAHLWDGLPPQVKTLAVDGVFPTHETILSEEYPLSANYFAVIRADTPDGHPARRITEWLLTEDGQTAVHEAGLGTLS